MVEIVYCPGGYERIRGISNYAPEEIQFTGGSRMFEKSICLAAAFLFHGGAALAGQDVISQHVHQAPTVDGVADDDVWKNVPAVISRDPVAHIDIELRSVSTDDSIFFLVRYPDLSENRQHKFLEWDDTLKVYRTGPKREDSFVFKWNMESQPVDLSISGDDSYKADIWYWKANRTDPVGFADDKYHLYGPNKQKKSQFILSQSGKRLYLTRLSDEGRSAYSSQTYEKFSTPEMPRYVNRLPEGSRADVRAKGMWNDGYWTVEFSRKLNTGHADDVQFNKNLDYTFGVSRYEIAGKAPNPNIHQPLYESGDIGDILTLKFK